MIISPITAALREQYRKSITRFQEKTLPITWAPRGILLSEGFAFCAAADLFNVDAVIESGVWDGHSTEIWAKYFLPEINITAIDIEIRKEALKHLAPYNIDLVKKDSGKVLPNYIRTLHQKKIGIFIDGPKGHEAIGLGKACLEFPNVAFVGIHDVHKLSFGRINATRIEMDKWGRAQFFTDEDWFVETYAWLDEGESQRDNEQRLTWVLYELITDPGLPKRKLGSYGPTIGFAFNQQKESG